MKRYIQLYMHYNPIFVFDRCMNLYGHVNLYKNSVSEKCWKVVILQVVYFFQCTLCIFSKFSIVCFAFKIRSKQKILFFKPTLLSMPGVAQTFKNLISLHDSRSTLIRELNSFNSSNGKGQKQPLISLTGSILILYFPTPYI